MENDMNKHPLSSRLRPDVECAPWIIDEVKKLEEALARIEGGMLNGLAQSIPALPSEDWWQEFTTRLQKVAREALEPKVRIDRRSDHDVHRGAQSIPCFCDSHSDHAIGEEVTAHGAFDRLREIAYRDEAKAVTVRVDDLRAALAQLAFKEVKPT
jgi:hypothetical protein